MNEHLKKIKETIDVGRGYSLVTVFLPSMTVMLNRAISKRQMQDGLSAMEMTWFI